MINFFTLPFIMLKSDKYDNSKVWAEFIGLIIVIGLLGTWIQLLYPLFPEGGTIPGIKAFSNSLFSYYIVLFPTIFLTSKSKSTWGIWMVIIVLIGGFTIGFSNNYIVLSFIINLILTILTILSWAFVNHDNFIRDLRKNEKNDKYKI